MPYFMVQHALSPLAALVIACAITLVFSIILSVEKPTPRLNHVGKIGMVLSGITLLIALTVPLPVFLMYGGVAMLMSYVVLLLVWLLLGLR